MNCELVRRYIDAYIDDEVDATTRLDFERHLEGCPQCRDEVEFGLAFKQHVKEHLRPTPAPAALRDSVERALREADSSQRSGGLANRFGWSARYAIPLGVAASAALAFAVSVTASDEDDAEILEDVVRVHASELPADVDGEQPQEVTSFFRPRMSFPVRPAEFERRDAKLLGARQINVREDSAAALYYDVGGHRVSVVVFDGTEAGLADNEPGVYYEQVNGYPVAVRNQNGVTYAFTGDLDSRALLHLAATARVTY